MLNFPQNSYNCPWILENPKISPRNPKIVPENPSYFLENIFKFPRNHALIRICFLSDEKIDRKTAFGRIAFAIAYGDQTELNEKITKLNEKVIHPLTVLDTPGKASVRVIILSDPNELEICFVDAEGFDQLSQVDPESDAQLNKEIQRDPFQDKWKYNTHRQKMWGCMGTISKDSFSFRSIFMVFTELRNWL